MKLQLITYGKNQFDINKFEPIKNDFIKPFGGLWSSPINSNYGWFDWCKENDFGDLSCSFRFDFIGNVFIIDNVNHLKKLSWISFMCPDFEKLIKLKYDAIYLTEKGEKETRFSDPSFYGWDCESVLIMNPSKIKEK